MAVMNHLACYVGGKEVAFGEPLRSANVNEALSIALEYPATSQQAGNCYIFSSFLTLQHTIDAPYQSSLKQLILLLRPSPTNPPKLPFILPTHLNLIPRPLASLPETPNTLLPHHTPMTNTTILRSIVLLS